MTSAGTKIPDWTIGTEEENDEFAQKMVDYKINVEEPYLKSLEQKYARK